MEDYYKKIKFRLMMSAAWTNNDATCGDVNENHGILHSMGKGSG